MNTDQNNNQTQSGFSNRPEQFGPDSNKPQEASNDGDVFGNVVYAYTRRQALEDGYQVDVSDMAREAGFLFPVYLTRAAYDKCVTVPEGVRCQDKQGRLWDVLWMLRNAIRRVPAGISRVPFAVYVRNDNRKARPVGLVSQCGPKDIDDPQPAITVMMPHED